jgi:peptidoglycan/xylan/chitin deacetylase (PgdA/CDA1 family)
VIEEMARKQRALGPARQACAHLVPAGAALVAAHFVPSAVVLGQWGPFSALVGELCRWQGPRTSARVALTFDDGPDPEGTPRVLDALDELDLRATFFVLGERVRAHPDLVLEIARRGHQLASHGDRHAHHLTRSPLWVHEDLRRACDAMAVLGHPPRWYRPAYGQVTGSTLVVARAMGLRTVLWSAWGREWAASGHAEVAARVARRLRPGAIVLLHDSDRFGPRGMWRHALGALPLVAAELRRRRLRSVTLDELVA